MARFLAIADNSWSYNFSRTRNIANNNNQEGDHRESLFFIETFKSDVTVGHANNMSQI